MTPRRHGVVWLGLLASALLAWALPDASFAQALATQDSGQVVVTATRTPQRVQSTVADVTVIDRADIDAAQGRTLAELLARQPGLQAWSNGGPGKAASLSMRGLESRHTLLLVDGARYGSATLGTPALENIPLDAIERIEIVRGPLAALYGSDAVGGVVQIFTRNGALGREAWRAQASASAGSAGHRSVGAAAQWQAGALQAAVQAQALRSTGLSATNERVPFGNFNPDRDGFDQDSASFSLGLGLAGGWRLQAQALHSEGLTQLDDGAGVNSRAGLRSQVLALSLAGPVRPGWQTRLLASRSEDGYTTLASASPFTDLGTTASKQSQVAWENTWATAWGSLLLVADGLQQKVARPGDAFAVSERRIHGLGAGLSGSQGGHHWQAALRRDQNSQFGRRHTGSLGYAYDATQSLRLGASWGSSFNAPSFNQLYFPNFGNPLLQPEEGLHREIHLRWAEGAHSLRLAFFSSRIRGYITPGQNPSNVDALVQGASLSVASQWAGWQLSASADVLDPRNDNPRQGNFGKQLPRRAKDLLRLAAERQLGAWTLGAQFLHNGPRFENASNSQRLPGYTLLDLRAELRLARDWALALKLNNASDRRYENVLGYNQPGREAFVTLRYASGR